MNTTELIHHQVDTLPEDAHLALLEYIDFLLHKYQKQTQETDETTVLVQELIMKRYEKYRNEPQLNSDSLQTVISHFNQKYNWNE